MTNCPGCGSDSLTEGLKYKQIPVVLNYRFATAEDAASLRREDLCLWQCNRCGLIFNAIFDLNATPYDENYENTQSCSDAFQSHLNAISADLSRQYKLAGSRIMEIGCGKGGFLHLICSNNNATGHGYDTSCEKSGWTDDGRVCFYQRYATAADAHTPTALILCRHVVEHVPEIGAFFELLHQISTDAGNAPIYIETPDWDWIAENNSHWDVFYEHCNYFSTNALANLARLHGFSVIRHYCVFGTQYQAIEIEPATSSETNVVPPTGDFLNVSERLASSRLAIGRLIEKNFGQAKWAIWGAGAKGVSLANSISLCPPAFIVDANPAKQNGYVAGTTIEILSPEDIRLRELAYVLVANPNYIDEIAEFAEQNNLSFKIESV